MMVLTSAIRAGSSTLDIWLYYLGFLRSPRVDNYAFHASLGFDQWEHMFPIHSCTALPLTDRAGLPVPDVARSLCFR
jgi:hypothetical protein